MYMERRRGGGGKGLVCSDARARRGFCQVGGQNVVDDF